MIMIHQRKWRGRLLWAAGLTGWRQQALLLQGTAHAVPVVFLQVKGARRVHEVILALILQVAVKFN